MSIPTRSWVAGMSMWYAILLGDAATAQRSSWVRGSQRLGRGSRLRRHEDQDPQAAGSGIGNSVRHLRGRERRRTGADVAFLGADADPRRAVDDVVDLVGTRV